ncbi:MAG: heme-binding domain-containing protein [Sulfurimonas sp.]|nr:heme-binding domain-containing protein [Sulfurimonas sp.]
MIKKIALFAIVILFAIQFIGIDKTNPPIDAALTLDAPEEVMTLLKTSCYDCHSNETVWPYYSDIAPVSFFVAAHVEDARSALNFSQWKAIDKKVKTKRLKRAIITVKNEMMALPSYLLGHEDARLSYEEKVLLTDWFQSELDKLGSDKKNIFFDLR